MKNQDIELNPELDNAINVNNLKQEFTEFPPTLNRYCEMKANSQADYELEKANYDETRSDVYLEIKKKGPLDGKVTEKHLEALIDTDTRVKKALRDMIEAERNLETIKGYVESLRAKKDMLVQLGADARKEA